MSNEENIDLIKAGMETFNAQDWDRFFEFSDESILTYAPGLQEPLRGLDANKERFKANAEAFPDQHIETREAFGQGDRIVLEGLFAGTHKGAFTSPDGQEVPPTNKRVELPIVLAFKVEGGKVTEEHDYFDTLTFMGQLGLAPQ